MIAVCNVKDECLAIAWDLEEAMFISAEVDVDTVFRDPTDEEIKQFLS
ncbi:MAG TPA: hypothetical protein VIY48_05020 [Candidatus Paceibacterota bacterium]